jgi:hypothetical protein
VVSAVLVVVKAAKKTLRTFGLILMISSVEEQLKKKSQKKEKI